MSVEPVGETSVQITKMPVSTTWAEHMVWHLMEACTEKSGQDGRWLEAVITATMVTTTSRWPWEASHLLQAPGMVPLQFQREQVLQMKTDKRSTLRERGKQSQDTFSGCRWECYWFLNTRRSQPRSALCSCLSVCGPNPEDPGRCWLAAPLPQGASRS